MIREVINSFRSIHNRSHVNWWVWEEMDNCFKHSIAMMERNEIYHAEAHYRNDWREAVAYCDFYGSWEEAIKRLIYDVLGNSEGHKDILLDCPSLAYGLVVANNKVFITIRGK